MLSSSRHLLRQPSCLGHLSASVPLLTCTSTPILLARAPVAAAAGHLTNARGFSDFSNKNQRNVPAHKSKALQYFGVEWFMGRPSTETNTGMIELPKDPFDPKPYKLDFRKYPGVASGLGAEFYYRDGQKSPLSYYHMKSPATGDMVAVGATDPRAREARMIDNYVKEKTRGFAVQIVLEGRGVKAYFEPKYPKLMVRLGVGAKVKDLTEYVVRDPDCEVSVNKKGDVVVVHGPNKPRVGTLAYRLLKVMQPKLQTYTGKGAHFAFHPVRRLAVRKK